MKYFQRNLWKIGILIEILLYAVSLVGGNAWSRPVDLSAPDGDVGVSDLKGNLEIWREIKEAGINLGKDSYLPLRYSFSSVDSIGGVFGPGFYLPMFEAKNVLIREQMMRAFLPCGKALYLRRDNVDPNKFQTVDQEWSGVLDGSNFIITRDDGWAICYHQGRLISIKNDDNQVFVWDYDASTHLATRISENGRTLVAVETNQEGLVDAIVFDGKRYELTYSERPLTEIVLGRPAIKQLAIALSSLKYPDGRAESFKFSLSPDIVPSVTFTDIDHMQTIYTWDVASSHVATENGPAGNWTYKIGEVTGAFRLPAISRTDSEGKTEGMAIDTKMGTYTATGIDGVITVTHVFKTPGPLYDKIQKIEQISSNIPTLIYRASFDENGRLVRSIDGKGIVTSFIYNDQGHLKNKVLSLSQDPQLAASLRAKEIDLVRLASCAKSTVETEANLESLALFYIGDMRDPSKALAIVPKITQRQIRYEIQLMAANHDDSLSYIQKIDKYKTLEKDFPEQKADLDNLIQQSQLMVNAGL